MSALAATCLEQADELAYRIRHELDGEPESKVRLTKDVKNGSVLISENVAEPSLRKSAGQPFQVRMTFLHRLNGDALPLDKKHHDNVGEEEERLFEERSHRLD